MSTTNTSPKKNLQDQLGSEFYIRLDESGCVMEVEGPSHLVLGYAHEDLLGTNWPSWLPRQEATRFQAKFSEYVRLENPMNIEFRFPHANGFHIWLDAQFYRLASEDSSTTVLKVADIARYARTRKNLQETKHQLNAYLRITDEHCIVSITDAEQKIVYVNKKFEEVTGYQIHEVMGETHALLKSDETAEEVYDDIYSTLQQGKVWKGELCNKDKWGDLYWVKESIVPIHDEKGALKQYMAISTDVTGHKQLEQTLARKEKILSRITENMIDVIGNINYQNRFDYISPSCERVFGFTPDEFIGISLYSFIHPDDHQKLVQAFDMSRQYQNPFQITVRHVTSSGEYIYVEYLGRFSSDSPMHRGVLVFSARDVTRQVIAEQKQEEILSILEVSTDYACIFDQNFKLVWSNRAFRQLFQLKENQYHEFDFTEYMSDVVENVHVYDIDDENSESRAVCSSTGRLHTPNGNIPVSQLLIRLYTEYDEPRYALVCRDISELEQNRQKLEEARRQADASNLSKSQFLASVSHELRTPLNSILGYAQILKQQSTMPRKNRDALQIIENSGGHLLELIDELLDISRIEAGKMKLEKETFSLPNFISSLKNMFQPRANEKGLDLRMQLDEELPEYVYTDSLRLRQVLINLLGNAVKFTKEGYVLLKVWQQASSTHFSVEDTGQGIERAHQNDLFEPFKQMDPSNSEKGSGLGLSITKGIVDQLGGYLSLNSEIGKGTVVHFQLQLSEQTPTRSPAKSDQFAPGQQFFAHGLTVLVVDDMQENRQVFGDMLKQLGCQVEEAEDGETCLQKCETFQPQLILLDIRMPDMDGLQATQLIREKQPNHRIVIIAMSAEVHEYQMRDCLDAGCDAFMAKPINFRELQQKLEKYFQNARQSKSSKVLSSHQSEQGSMSFNHDSQSAGKTPSKAVFNAVRQYVHEGDLMGLRKYVQESGATNDSDIAFLNEVEYHLRYFNVERLKQLIVEYQNEK